MKKEYCRKLNLIQICLLLLFLVSCLLFIVDCKQAKTERKVERKFQVTFRGKISLWDLESKKISNQWQGFRAVTISTEGMRTSRRASSKQSIAIALENSLIELLATEVTKMA